MTLVKHSFNFESDILHSVAFVYLAEIKNIYIYIACMSMIEYNLEC